MMTAEEYSQCVKRCARIASLYARIKEAGLRLSIAYGEIAGDEALRARLRAGGWSVLIGDLEKVTGKRDAGSARDIRVLNRADKAFREELRTRWSEHCGMSYRELTDEDGRFVCRRKDGMPGLK